MTYSVPVPSRLRKADVWQLAERTATRLDFEIADPLEPIVGLLGGKIVFKDTIGSSEKPESIIVRSKKDFTIYLGRVTSWERDRFTIAHELGHLFLHYPMAQKQSPGLPMKATRWVDEEDSEQMRAEWEANWFSAAFLMPEVLFRKAFNPGKLAQIAIKFGVSVPAVKNRAKSLSLMD